MKKAILARKIGMTQIFTEDGILVPVTVLEAGPCFVTQKKTVEKEGYNAIQVSFLDVKEKKLNKPKKGHFDKSETSYKKYLREFRVENVEEYDVGSEIKASIFKPGDKVDVIGISKGKGFQGAIKRHGQSRGPMSHGSKYHRGLGSLSAGTDPGKVKKGKKMPGHMGNKRVTIQNLEIVRSDDNKNLILIKGAVPGPKGVLLSIKNTVKA